MHFEKVRRAKASSNRWTGYWYAVPSRANLRKRLWCSAIWMWKYASFKSTDATSPWGESAPGSVPLISSRTDACRALCRWAWDLASVRVLHLFWAPQNNGCKSCSPACSLGFVIAPFLSRLHSSCLRIMAFWGNVRDCDTPLKQGGVCIWIEGRTHALLCQVTSVRFLK